MELKNKKITILGDSITEAVGVNEGYAERLAKLAECTVYNHGIGGTRIAKQINPSNPKFDYDDYCTRIEKLEEDADIIIIFGGQNDYGHGDVPLGSFDNHDPYTFYGGCHTLMTKIYERYPGKTAVIITPLHCIEEFNLTSRCGEYLHTYVKIIREVAEYYSLPVLDLYAASGIQPEIPVIRELYTLDGLHPNDNGHALIAEKIFKFLKAL